MNNFNIPKSAFMKRTKTLVALLAVTAVIVISCQKETSFEQGNSTASVGSLSVDANGSCLGAVVGGVYYKDTTLKSSNYIDISVQVDTAGTYNITSDTVNGYYFKASGNFSNTGTIAVRLAGSGKPLSIGTNVFTVTYNGTTCEFSVDVIAAPPGGGGGGNAVFTINCTGAVPAGTYTAATPLTSANTVTLNVTVTTAGTWTVTTAPAVNGVIFAGTGTFSGTGAQTIQLSATGTPTAAGTNNHTVTGATATCTFPLTVTAAVPPDYFPRTNNSNWSYEIDDDSEDSVRIFSQATKVIGGNTYNVFWYNNGIEPIDTFSYYRRNGADYFEFGDLSYGLLDEPVRGEFIMLKDNQAVNATWDSSPFTGVYTNPTTGQSGTVTLRWQMTVLQQNGTLSLTTSTGTVSHTNVIQIKQELQQSVGPDWVPIYHFRNSYGLNKGLLKQDIYVGSTLATWWDCRRFVIF